MSFFNRTRRALLALTTIICLLPTALAAANKLTFVSNFGYNPSNAGMYLYLPPKPAPNPPILVALHWCGGSAQNMFLNTEFASLADTYGYIVIFPNSPHTADHCWDVSSRATLTHNGGSDSLAIANMIKYVVATYKADLNRVFAMGISSGAMMTNVLLGAYPDVFAAGSAWAGVAFGCFAANSDAVDLWSADCAAGKIIKTGAEWNKIVQAAYPGYTGYRPKMWVAHGAIDAILNPQNLQEEIKQWTAVNGQTANPMLTKLNWPEANWTTWEYSTKVRATSAAGVGHNINPNEDAIIQYFGLKCQEKVCFSRISG